MKTTAISVDVIPPSYDSLPAAIIYFPNTFKIDLLISTDWLRQIPLPYIMEHPFLFSY